MILDELIDGVSVAGLRTEIMRREHIGRVLPHESQLVDHLIDELRPDHVERTLGDAGDVSLRALRTRQIIGFSIEQDQEGVPAVDCLFLESEDAVEDVEVADHPGLASLAVTFGAAVVEVGLVGDGFGI